MLIDMRVCILAAAFLPGVVMSSAQQTPSASAPADRSIHLNVVVEAKSGPPVAGLGQEDFTLLDNASARPFTSFKAVSAEQTPVEVIVLIDAVNTRFSTAAYARDEIQKFLRANGAKMAHPTTIAVLTDKGTEIQKGFSTDGNELSHSIDHYTSGLREINRSAGYWGATERLDICLKAIRDLTGYAATLPGRKIILWVSPGWPLLSGVRMELTSQQERQIFDQIVSFSAQLRQANVTLYDINPRGVTEPLMDANYYEQFVKGIRKPNQAQIGDLGLQVLAVQSGGLTLESSSDVAGMLKRCLADTESWYEIIFDMPPAEQPNEYHHVEIRLDKQGLTARTRNGYYAQPLPMQ
jgi:VWFA-related protein